VVASPAGLAAFHLQQLCVGPLKIQQAFRRRLGDGDFDVQSGSLEYRLKELPRGTSHLT